MRNRNRKKILNFFKKILINFFLRPPEPYQHRSAYVLSPHLTQALGPTFTPALTGGRPDVTSQARKCGRRARSHSYRPEPEPAGNADAFGVVLTALQPTRCQPSELRL